MIVATPGAELSDNAGRVGLVEQQGGLFGAYWRPRPHRRKLVV